MLPLVPLWLVRRVPLELVLEAQVQALGRQLPVLEVAVGFAMFVQVSLGPNHIQLRCMDMLVQCRRDLQ